MWGGSEETERKLELCSVSNRYTVHMYETVSIYFHRGGVNVRAGEDTEGCNVAMSRNCCGHQEPEEGMHKFYSGASSGSSTYLSAP